MSRRNSSEIEARSRKMLARFCRDGSLSFLDLHPLLGDHKTSLEHAERLLGLAKLAVDPGQLVECGQNRGLFAGGLCRRRSPRHRPASARCPESFVFTSNRSRTVQLGPGPERSGPGSCSARAWPASRRSVRSVRPGPGRHGLRLAGTARFSLATPRRRAGFGLRSRRSAAISRGDGLSRAVNASFRWKTASRHCQAMPTRRRSWRGSSAAESPARAGFRLHHIQRTNRRTRPAGP